jgi:hypothetical protein
MYGYATTLTYLCSDVAAPTTIHVTVTKTTTVTPTVTPTTTETDPTVESPAMYVLASTIILFPSADKKQGPPPSLRPLSAPPRPRPSLGLSRW